MGTRLNQNQETETKQMKTCIHKMSRSRTARERAYTIRYLNEIRKIVLPAHDFNKQTCCRDCYRHYHKIKMREYRAERFGEVGA